MGKVGGWDKKKGTSERSKERDSPRVTCEQWVLVLSPVAVGLG